MSTITPGAAEAALHGPALGRLSPPRDSVQEFVHPLGRLPSNLADRIVFPSLYLDPQEGADGLLDLKHKFVAFLTRWILPRGALRPCHDA